MAPKRGGGSGSSSSSSGDGGVSISSCPGAFQSEWGVRIVEFSAYCVFCAVALITLIALCMVRKRHAGAKKLAGPVYLLALLAYILSFILIIISIVLQECSVTPLSSYYKFAIAEAVFFRLSLFLLLCVLLWGVNYSLRQRLGNASVFSTIYKIVLGGVLGIMGALTCAYIGLEGYNYWTYTEDGFYADALYDEQTKLGIAYWVLYLVSIVIGGALSTVTLVSLRSKRIPTSDLTGWTAGLVFSMLIWVLFIIVRFGASLSGNYFELDATYAFLYIEHFFRALSFIILLFMAKSRLPTAIDENQQLYNNPAYPAPQQPPYGPVPVPQQQYAYNNANGTQQYYYQQQPVYNGHPELNTQAYVK